MYPRSFHYTPHRLQGVRVNEKDVTPPSSGIGSWSPVQEVGIYLRLAAVFAIFAMVVAALSALT